MARSVNFVHQRQQQLTKAQAKDRLIFRWSATGLAAVALVAMISFGVRIFMGSRVDRVTTAQQQTRSSILSQEEVEKTFLIGVQKLGILAQLFEERLNKQQAISYFSSVFGPQVLVKSIEYDGSVQLLTFRLQAEDIFVLERVFLLLNGPDIKTRYQSVKSSNLRRAEDGTYQMTVAVVLAPPQTSQAKEQP